MASSDDNTLETVQPPYQIQQHEFLVKKNTAMGRAIAGLSVKL
ncbi:hypothetical protein VB712_07300 [Spirulina sp. CCNP1310]|nr:hypothetical protein [Spirulina sp. CCNP1310]MEA5419030.1 hypothetical protein [Spirulina sp. CCNP1310]